jgi:hypothetical protein
MVSGEAERDRVRGAGQADELTIGIQQAAAELHRAILRGSQRAFR